MHDNEGIKMYLKFHDPWETTHYLSAGAGNHLESQWDEAKDDADEHTHDLDHYTKAESDAKFFSTEFYTGFDADTLDGSHFSDIITAGLPVGAIVMWSEDEDTIPSGWYICDGRTVGETTLPDLRERFIVGAGDTYAVGNTGGNTSTSVTASFTVLSHVITADEMPIHTHPWLDRTNSYAFCYYTVGTTGPVNAATSASRTTSNTGEGMGHTHTGNSITFDDVAYEPYYYSLYYIMKVG